VVHEGDVKIRLDWPRFSVTVFQQWLGALSLGVCFKGIVVANAGIGSVPSDAIYLGGVREVASGKQGMWRRP
jgi:hypothetical protein